MYFDRRENSRYQSGVVGQCFPTGMSPSPDWKAGAGFLAECAVRVVREIWGSWLEGGEGGGRVGRGRERENESKTVSRVY